MPMGAYFQRGRFFSREAYYSEFTVYGNERTAGKVEKSYRESQTDLEI